MNAITKVPDDNRMVEIMRDSLYPGAKPESVRMALGYCQARGLDPMLKPVHIVPMWVKGATKGERGEMRDVVMPGIALYRIQAARSGVYNGKSEPEFGPDQTKTFAGTDRDGNERSRTVTFPAWCRVTVKRGDAEFTAKEYWTENYATAGRDSEAPNEMWAKRPYGQIAKCAEAQALRMAFPELTGGEPTAEEMEGKTEPRTVQSTVVEDARPAGDLRAYAQTLTQPAEAARWPVLAPSGDLAMVAQETWPRAVERALAKLESAMAVRQWQTAMSEHLDTIALADPAVVTVAEEAITARLASFADGEREPGMEG